MIIAHRGGTPENTLTAFKNSTRHSIRAIEFDIHLTSDNEIVVTHNNIIKGVRICNSTYKELQQLNDEIPTLSRALDTIAEASIQYNVPVPIIDIEIKPWGVVSRLSRFITEYLDSHSVIRLVDIVFTSYLHTEVLMLREMVPLARIGFIYRCWPMNIIRTLTENDVDLVVLSSHITKNKGIEELLSHSIETWVYTINNLPDALVLLKDCKVSGVITDIPHEMNNKIVNLI